MDNGSEKFPVMLILSISFYKIYETSTYRASGIKREVVSRLDGYMVFERPSNTIPKKGGAVVLFDDKIGSVWKTEERGDKVFVEVLAYDEDMSLIHPEDGEDGKPGPAETEFAEKMIAAGWTDLALVLRH